MWTAMCGGHCIDNERQYINQFHTNRYICCVHVIVCYKPFIRHLNGALKKRVKRSRI